MSHTLVFASIIFLGIALLLITMFLLTKFLGPNNKDSIAKNEPYESGISEPVGGTNIKFSIKFFIVAILFVLFDVEIIFMFPWAVNVVDLGLLGLLEMFSFMFVLVAGLIYIYKKKALSWD